VVTYTKNYGNFVSTYTRNIILLEFGLYYRVLRDAEFEFDNFMFTRSSPCQPILKKHGISVSTYTKNIKMPTKKWFLGVFGDAEFEFDLEKILFHLRGYLYIKN